LYKAKEKRAWSALFLHAAFYLHDEQSLPANADGRYREMSDINGQAAGMAAVRGGVIVGGVSASAAAFASADLTAPARVHNPTCQGQPRRIAPQMTHDDPWERFPDGRPSGEMHEGLGTRNRVPRPCYTALAVRLLNNESETPQDLLNQLKEHRYPRSLGVVRPPDNFPRTSGYGRRHRSYPNDKTGKL